MCIRDRYYDVITKKVTDVLHNSLTPEASYLFTMSIHHECQHQELLVYDLQHLLGDQYRPVRMTCAEKPSTLEQESIKIPGGIYNMGYSGNDFCYDVELPEHKVYLNDFQIENFPVTNAQYLEFIEDGGYDNFSFWLSDGWDAVKKNEWSAPMYWEKENDEWFTRDFVGKRKINPDEPVCHVSFYEAMAFCKWAGKDYQQKPNGRRLHYGMSQKMIKQFTHGVMSLQLKIMQTFWIHVFGIVGMLAHMKRERVTMVAIK